MRRRTVEEVAAAEAAFLADALEQTDPAPVLDEDEAMLPQLDDVDAPADEDDELQADRDYDFDGAFLDWSY